VHFTYAALEAVGIEFLSLREYSEGIRVRRPHA